MPWKFLGHFRAQPYLNELRLQDPLLIGGSGMLAAASILQFTIYVFKNSNDLFARADDARNAIPAD